MTVFAAGRAGKSSFAPSSRLFGAAALAFLLLFAISVPAGAQVSPITLTSVQYTVAGQPFYEQIYSTPAYPPQQAGDLVLVNTAFGLIVANTVNGTTQYRGFATQEVSNRPTDACPFPNVIDRHQGVRGYRAVGNWLVIGNYGGSPTCKDAVIFTRSGSNYTKVGDVTIPNFFANAPSENYGIVGDFAWIPSGIGQWTQINLITRTVVSSGSTFQDTPDPGLWEVRQVTPTPPNNYEIRLTANPNAPPTSSAAITNVSAAARPAPDNTINYYGDRWHFVDVSTTFPTNPIDGIEWDFLYSGTPPLVPDVSVPPPTVPPAPWNNFFGYFPCGNAADLVAGSSACAQGPAIPSARVAMRSHNVNGWATTQWDSAAIPFASPTINIVGYAGGTLSVLTGGSAIASGTQGNIAEANFAWTFTPGGPAGGVGAHTVPVPAGAANFQLLVTWKGGFQASLSGNIVQTQLVPNFSLSPNPVVKSQAITLRNMMQIGAVTLGSVEYAVTTSSATPGTYDGQLNPSFYTGCATTCPPSATATVTAPATIGNYFMHLRYNHSGGNAFASAPFQVVDQPPYNPVPTIYQDAGGNVLAPFQGGAFQVATNQAWYLFDDEVIQGGGTHPGVTFALVTPTGESGIGSAANRGPVSWTPTSNCASGCSVKATVGTVSATRPVVISTPPPIGVNVTLSGPASGNVGQPLTFTASATGPGAITYRWDCNWSGVGPPAYTIGSSTQVCTYSSPGGKNVVVQASSGSDSDIDSRSVNIVSAGPPPPATTYSITGASLNPLNGRYEVEAGKPVQFTATETRASSWTWTIPGFTQLSGQSVVYSFPQAGTFSVQLSVTGNGTQTVGTANATIGFTVTPPAFRFVIVPDAASIDFGGDTWGTAVTLANPSSAPISLAMAFVLFSPDAPTNMSLLNLQYLSPMTLPPGANWATEDIVRHLGLQTPEGASNKGTVVIKYEGANTPIASSRVTFAPKTNPGNISYGAVLPSFKVDGSGNVTPQGLITWSEDGITQAQAIAAPQNTMDVTVTISGTGSGTVVSNPSGISCPGTCTSQFDDAATSSVILQAIPAAGSTFEFGTSSCDSINPMNGACVLTAFNGPRSVTVTFTGSAPPPPPPPTGNSSLQVTKSGTGSGTVTSSPAGISCGSTCSANFTTNSTVTLSAEAATGSSFGGWSGACSGTGACVVNLSSNLTVGASFSANAPPPSGQPEEQSLIGMRTDNRYRFGVTLFNASGNEGQFQIRILDANNATVIFKDENGNDVGTRTFTIKAFQSVYLTDTALGLGADVANPSTWKTYVVALKRLSATGKLVGYGTSIDRTTRDFIRVVDDHQVASAGTNGLVVHEIPASSRFDSPSGAKWRTDLRMLNRATRPRNLTVQYHYGQSIGTPQASASAQVTIAPNSMLTWDDVIGTLVDLDPSVELIPLSTFGILRIYYAADGEESSAPLLLSSRNYDDQPSGTSGTQIPSYTSAQYATAGQNLYLTGVEESARYEGRIGVFSADGSPANGRIAVLRPDGSEAGSIGFSVGAGGGQRLLQISLMGIPGFLNPQAPVTVRVEVASGRAAAYAFNVDRITKDTSFIQGFPLN